MEGTTGPTEPPTETSAKRQKTDHVRLNVGGTIFETSVTTLTGASSFFASMFSRWDDSLHSDCVFIDRDADTFRILLSYMRTGIAVLPSLDHDLCARVILDAQYLAVDGLLQSIKAVAWRNMNPHKKKACKDDDAACAVRFDAGCASIESALREGILPARFFSAAPEPPPKPRSFSLRVRGGLDTNDADEPGEYWWGVNEDEMPQAGEGECVYLHSAVLTGAFAGLRRLQSTEDKDPDSTFAKAACYLHSGRKTFSGNFILQYKRADAEDDDEAVFTLAKRGLDDAGTKSDAAHVLHDINFREVLDTVIDGPINLRAVGLGDWEVHGWVGRLEDIPRAGMAATHGANSRGGSSGSGLTMGLALGMGMGMRSLM
jgi:hypothetical protein|eukprot:Transcript_29161.p1 GENE.Transcript_29161~~Transcript_29161.p1  ORF type:complete len:373 (-),score=67.84 Transcript_29161:221-1339(-)